MRECARVQMVMHGALQMMMHGASRSGLYAWSPDDGRLSRICGYASCWRRNSADLGGPCVNPAS